MHHELIASQRHQRRAAPRFHRHVGDRADLVRIQVGQLRGQVDASRQIAADAVDADADPVRAAADIVLQQRADLAD
jgi:hypothetical protein